MCDPWSENETEWHRAWKDKFPEDWQEVMHQAEDGERHIADVKTHDGWVLEFQHSNIYRAERQSREAFYRSMVWIVDGTRRQRDHANFFRAWEGGERTRNPFSTKRRITSHKSALLSDWMRSNTHVLFDFGGSDYLWWLYPGSDERRAYVQAVSRQQFTRVHQTRNPYGPSEFDSMVDNFFAYVSEYETPPVASRPPQPVGVSPGSTRSAFIRRGYRL
jgi:competence protein CoiA